MYIYCVYIFERARRMPCDAVADQSLQIIAALALPHSTTHRLPKRCVVVKVDFRIRHHHAAIRRLRERVHLYHGRVCRSEHAPQVAQRVLAALRGAPRQPQVLNNAVNLQRQGERGQRRDRCTLFNKRVRVV